MNHTCGAATAAYAVSRSGHYLLVVDTHHVTLWDVARQRLVESDTGPLLDVRTFLASNRGSEGKWWITDDLRYVLIEPDEDVKNWCGNYGSGGPMYMPIDGIQVDVQQSGLIFDRVTDRCATFPAQIDWKRALDAESVNGQLRILYGREFNDEQFIVADASGRRVPMRGSGGLKESSFRRWMPDRNEIWSLAGPATTWHDEHRPNSEAHIRRWDYSTGSVQDFELTVKEIRSALAHAP